MSSRLWLILDVNYLAWRSVYAFGGLSHEQTPTSVTFGVLREIQTLGNLFATPHIAFCFDHGLSKRVDAFPGYKKSRKECTDENILKLGKQVRKEVRLLKHEYLSELRYQNIFYQKGYEADDMIASLCTAIKLSKEKDEAVIVSADHDLFQKLHPRITMWNPTLKRSFTYDWFKKTYHGLEPARWYKVKAIAGCKSDEIPGIRGVGESTAAKYLSGGKTKFDSVIAEWVNSEQYEVNRSLTRLPYPGCQACCLVDDSMLDRRKVWEKLTKRLGIKALKSPQPGFGLRKV